MIGLIFWLASFPSTESCTPKSGDGFILLSDYEERLRSAVGGDVQLSALEDDGAGSVSASPALSCSSWGGACDWWSPAASEERGGWFKGQGRPQPARLRNVTGRRAPPRSPMAVALSGPEGRDGDPQSEVLLLSRRLPCVARDGPLSFRFWLSPAASLRVCVVKEGRELSCSARLRPSSPAPAAVPLSLASAPSNSQVVLRARLGTSEDFALVDDVRWAGRLCGVAAGGGGSRPRLTAELLRILLSARGGSGRLRARDPRPTPAPTFKPSTSRPRKETDSPPKLRDPCVLIPCDFEPGSSCATRYVEGSEGWAWSESGEAGLPRGAYLFARGPRRGAVAELGPFRLAQRAVLTFRYYATGGAVMEVYRGEGRREEVLFASTDRARPDRWRGQSILLPDGFYPKLGVRTRGLWDGGSAVALDEVRLLRKLPFSRSAQEEDFC